MRNTLILAMVLVWGMGGGYATASVDLSLFVEVDKATYNQAETVSWTLSAQTTTTGGSTNAGIAGLEIDLTESPGETMNDGTIDAQWAAAGYQVADGGTASGSKVEGISVVLLPLSGTETPLGGDDSKKVVATGSFTANTLGSHTLSSSTPFLTDQAYFSAAALTSTANFDSVTNGSAMYEVVPEPAGIIAILAGLSVVLGLWDARRCNRYRR